MKKTYISPEITVVNMLVENVLMAGSEISETSLSVSSDESIEAQSVNVRSCPTFDWDDDEF